MRSRRIAYLTALWWEPDGSDEEERYALALARGIAAASRGAHAVEVVGYGPADRFEKVQGEVSLRVLRANRVGDPAELLSWQLAEVVAAADLVHIHHPFTRTGDAGLLLAKQHGKPVCATLHGPSLDALGVPLGSLALADRLFCPSNFVASFMRTQRDTATAVAALPVQDGVDIEFFMPSQRQEPRDGVLFVGRLLPHQGIERLIAALPAGMRLTVCGRPSPYHLDYLERVKAAGNGLHVIMSAGPQEVRELYRRAAICVLPAVSRDCYGGIHFGGEVTGWALLEAMACATPVAAARIGALPELVRQGENGWLFDDTAELGALLQRLNGDPGLAAKAGKQARALVERQFDVRAQAAVMSASYKELLPRMEIGMVA
jgi:glycosyltransferase involved in cell wall biosynthesis